MGGETQWKSFIAGYKYQDKILLEMSAKFHDKFKDNFELFKDPTKDETEKNRHKKTFICSVDYFVLVTV